MDLKRNKIRGETELSKYLRPPFEFQGVTSHVFPLRADITQLRRFCDSYLNSLLGGEIAEFHPALPFVFLAVLHYDKMFATSQGQSSSEIKFMRDEPRSWVAQNELLFAVPVEWYRKENGRAIFNDWAYLTPFIFVDSDYSLTLGREVYGWPKLAALFTSESGLWRSQPQDGSNQKVVYTADLPWTNVHIQKARLGGRSDSLKKLLDINFKVPSTFSQLRPDVNPFSLLLSWPQTVLGGLATMYDWMGVFGGLANPWSQPAFGRQPAASMMAKGLRTLSTVWSDLLRKQIVSALLPASSPQQARDFLERGFSAEEERGQIKQFSFPQITLKQFPETKDLQKACYQAIVESPLHVIRYGNSGLLGDANLLWADMTGGFQFQLHYDKSDEKNVGKLILEGLGLEVASSKVEPNGESTATLNPVYPFWFEGNLRYDKGEKIWWRVKGRTHPATSPRASRETDLPLVLSAGGPFQPTGVSIELPLDVILYVYPLKAKQSALRNFCQDYLNDPYLPDKTEFQPYTAFKDSYVYLVVMSYKRRQDSPPNAAHEVVFFVPAKWCKYGQVVREVLIAPYAFIDSDNDTIIDREWNGRPTMDATLTLVSDWPNAPGSRLELKTEVIPNSSGQINSELLLQIDHSGRRVRVPNPDPQKVIDRVLFPSEGATGNRSISNVMMKEFRDAADPRLACYQELMSVTQKVEKACAPTELGNDTQVVFYRYPNSYQIVELLGLDAKQGIGTDLPPWVCKPIRPFWLTVHLAQKESRTDVYWRTDPDLAWEPKSSGS